MGRIWRGLKLGMKSLLLHKLRSGLTVLGIVFGVAAVISMLAVGEGSSRDAQERIQQLGATNIIVRSVKPSDEAQAAGGRPARILNYGLKYDDYDRILATVPTIKKALPIREIRKQIRHLEPLPRRPGRRHDPRLRRLQPARDRPAAGSSPRPTTRGTRTSPCSPPRPPGPSSPTRTRSASRSSSAPTTTRSSA